jgi:hypothetical protein
MNINRKYILLKNKYDRSILHVKKLGNGIAMMHQIKMKSVFFIALITINNVKSMENIAESKEQIIKACQSFHFFHPKEIIKKGKSPELLFNSNLTITPDEKSIIIATEGKVYITPTKPFFLNQTIDLIIHHPSTKMSTMIAAHNIDNKSLLIASAGNYFESDTNKWISEIILYNSQTETYKNNPLKWPIQAIKISPNGKHLIAANLSTILLFEIINLKLQLHDAINLIPITTSCHQSNYQKNTVVDLAINKDMTEKDFYIIAAGTNGLTQLSTTAKNATELYKVKQNIWNETIRKIHFPTMEKIMYVTDTGETKIIDLMDQLLEYDLESESSSFSHSPFTFSNAPRHYEQTSIDTGSEIAATYWTKNETASAKERSTLYVFKMYNQKKSRLKLIANFSEKTYEDISNKGQLEEHNTHFLTATLYNSTLAALASNGEIFVWNLSSAKKAFSTNDDSKSSGKEKEKEEPDKRSYTQKKSKTKTEKDSIKKSKSLMASVIQHTPRPSHSSSPNIAKKETSIHSPQPKRTPRQNSRETK